MAEAARGYAFNVRKQKALLVTCWHMASMYFVEVKAEAGTKRNCNTSATETTTKREEEEAISPRQDSDFGFVLFFNCSYGYIQYSTLHAY